MKLKFNVPGLRRWFFENKRDLPWREQPSPYAVWVSEVMLQQTQVEVVIPYFLSWMRQFPTISALASASIETVIKAWEGLGYYSRARNLHEGARYIAARHKGIFPEDPEQWSAIKGIGPYTKGAILSFAYHKRACAIDGNVQRVLARYFAVEDDLSKTPGKRLLEDYADKVLPLEKPWEIAEALIELGAKVCKKAPLCFQCPLRADCKGLAIGNAAALPNKGKKVQIELLKRSVAVIASGDYLLVRRCQKGEVMQDLHEFPFFTEKLSEKAVEDLAAHQLGLSLRFRLSLREVSHSFTRFRVKLFPFYFYTPNKIKISGYQWIDGKNLGELAFSSGHRRIMEQVQCLN